jgi:hypothetical protein
MFIYSIAFSSYSGAITQVITIASIAIFFARHFIKKQTTQMEARNYETK